MKLSFCTTCQGRLKYLQQTLPVSIADNPEPEIEFVVLDYGSQDGLADWVRAEMMEHIQSGKLVFYRVEGVGHFFHAHAKNLVHRLASGTFLCNLDSDNFAGRGGGRFLLENFAKTPNAIGRPMKGTGRIALSAENFLRFGGYDEEMIYGWGQEDNDFHDRMMGSHWVGYFEIPVTLNERLDHTDEERGMHCRETDILKSENRHSQIMIRNREARRWVANQGHYFGYWESVEKNFVQQIPGAWLVASAADRRRFGWSSTNQPASPLRRSPLPV